jgi:hypothetical protein
MMLKARIPVGPGNKAIKEGSLPKILGQVFEQAKPESVYFTSDHGERTMFMFFDMKDSSQIPSLSEPLFMNLDAALEYMPVMNQDDLKKGLEAVAKMR